MRSHTPITLVTGIIIGSAGGWLAKSAVTPAAPVPAAAPVAVKTETKRSTRDDAAQLEKTRVAKRWLERIEKDGARGLVGEIPPGDFQALLETMMASPSIWTDARQVQRMVFLITAWAEQDQEAALAWARARQVPQQREIAFIGVAAAVGKKDPMAGFNIFAEMGEVTIQFSSDSLHDVMHQLYKDAAAKGVDAMLDIAGRTPSNKSGGLSGVPIVYPEGFDFEKLMDGLAKTTWLGGDHSLMKAFEPSDPLGQWVLQDRDAAFDYAVARSGTGQRTRLSGLTYDLEKKIGTLEAERWMGEKLAALSPEQAAAVLPGSGLLDSPGILRKYIAGMPEEAAAEFRFLAIKASPVAMEILQDVPEVEDRLAVVEQLRGVKDTNFISYRLQQWDVPKDRIEEVIKTITRPKE